MQDIYITEWNRAVSNSNDGILYRTYKLKPFYSHFINGIIKPSYQYSFLKFVTKNHNLPVVRGKWFQPKPYSERLCSTCSFRRRISFSSPMHQAPRFRNKIWERPSMHRFVELMSSQRNAVIIKLAAFVHIGLQRENV